MGKLIVAEFMTLDGVAQSGGQPDEDTDGGFRYGGWHAPFLDLEASKVMLEGAQSMDALLLGRRTYDVFAAFWPNAPEEMPFTAVLNDVPKYVATRTLTEPLSWQGSTVLGQPLEESVAALKDRYEEVHVIGSLNLVQSLLRFGLVDRLDLWVDPIVLGTGKKVFGEGVPPTALRLVESVSYPNGVLHLAYETAGEPEYGTVG
ncbi:MULTISPECIES: dihydrofolate reductase family protein [Amycolatopsis]|uniref:Dihydrofolate reductase n=2 Tax=Amycolatopsis TaxID=1813 RepID=A0A1I3MST8_9PSEU|nr:dihydrofolate reductase family protein [Amycolatopsis sacchari]SFJ00037.1 Dihydrofolate reductase [Amycolatopsis sacchari]